MAAMGCVIAAKSRVLQKYPGFYCFTDTARYPVVFTRL